jgi:hypothetical protein
MTKKLNPLILSRLLLKRIIMPKFVNLMDHPNTDFKIPKWIKKSQLKTLIEGVSDSESEEEIVKPKKTKKNKDLNQLQPDIVNPYEDTIGFTLLQKQNENIADSFP